jgi:hypothetical protein
MSDVLSRKLQNANNGTAAALHYSVQCGVAAAWLKSDHTALHSAQSAVKAPYANKLRQLLPGSA